MVCWQGQSAKLGRSLIARLKKRAVIFVRELSNPTMSFNAGRSAAVAALLEIKQPLGGWNILWEDVSKR
jgi:hypothetical protein